METPVLPPKSKAARRRERLFAESPNCRKCETPMILPSDIKTKEQPNNMATLFHTMHTVDFDGVPATILICLKCATLENRKKESEGGIDVLRLKSSKQGMCTCACGNRHIKSIKQEEPVTA